MKKMLSTWVIYYLATTLRISVSFIFSYRLKFIMLPWLNINISSWLNSREISFCFQCFYPLMYIANNLRINVHEEQLYCHSTVHCTCMHANFVWPIRAQNIWNTCSCCISPVLDTGNLVFFNRLNYMFYYIKLN